MKKIFLATAVVLGLMTFWSCQKEISLEVGGLPVANNRRCINCTYLPFCDSSEFTYLVDGVDTMTGPVFIKNDTLVNGQSFSQVSAIPGFGQGLLYSCAGGDYRLAFPLSQLGLDPDSIRQLMAPLLDSLLPVPADPSSLAIPDVLYATILKANNAQGSTWLDTITAITIPFGTPPLVFHLRVYAGIEYTYLEKNSSRTVLGRNYTNVQHVQGKPKIGLTIPVPVPVPLPPIDGQLDFYLAKDIGVIEMEQRDSTGVQRSAKLMRFRL
ncbi:MAG: hypothetical protein EOO15_01935 [Chitinophagaceae bacterium]|nr:MAG: hypothetical protein EOO15_01935 [Chitinophagaceae bacterium]